MSDLFQVTAYVANSRESGLDQLVSSLEAGIAYAIFDTSQAAIQNEEAWGLSYHGSISYDPDRESARVSVWVTLGETDQNDADYYIDPANFDVKSVSDFYETGR